MIDKWFVNDIEYIKHEMQVHEIEAQQLLAGSQTVEFNNNEIPKMKMKICGKVLS